MRTCLNRLIGRCTNGCKEDYDTNHHPNNYDCVNYQEANIMEFTVKKMNIISWRKKHAMD